MLHGYYLKYMNMVDILGCLSVVLIYNITLIYD